MFSSHLGSALNLFRADFDIRNSNVHRALCASEVDTAREDNTCVCLIHLSTEVIRMVRSIDLSCGHV